MKYRFQNLSLGRYSHENGLNLKLIAGMFLVVIALSMFATLVAADDVDVNSDSRAGIRAEIAGIRADAAARVNASIEGGLASRRNLDPERMMVRYGMFRSKLAHYIKDQCEEMRGTDRIACFERILSSSLPANLTAGENRSQMRSETAQMHERRFKAFRELAERAEHKLAAGVCLNTLTNDELLAAYADVRGEVEAKLIAFGNQHATVPAEVAIQVQTSNGTITVPKMFLAKLVLPVLGKDSSLAQKCLTAAKDAKEEAQEQFKQARDNFKQKARELKEKRNATVEEKNERLAAAISALIEARIKAAQKFEAHGASHDAVASFVVSMEAKKTLVSNSTFEQRKVLLHEINDEWHAFVRATVSTVVTSQLEAATLRLKAAVSQAETTITQLKATGKDVSQLEQLALEANSAITATQESNLTMHEAMHRLGSARADVQHLVRAVNAVLNNRPIPRSEGPEDIEAPEDVVVNSAASGEVEN